MCVSHIAFIATKDAFKVALVSALDRKRCSTWTQPKYNKGRKKSQVEFDAEIDEIMTIASELSQGRSHDVAPGWSLDQADRFNELADAAFLEKLYEYLKDSRRDARIAAEQAAKEVFLTAIEIAVQGVDDTDQEMLESVIRKAVEGTKPTAYIAAAHVAQAVLNASLDAAVMFANETCDEAVEEAFLEGMGTGCGGW